MIDPELTPLLEFFPQMRLSAEALPVLRASIVQLAASAPVPEVDFANSLSEVLESPSAPVSDSVGK